MRLGIIPSTKVDGTSFPTTAFTEKSPSTSESAVGSTKEIVTPESSVTDSTTESVTVSTKVPLSTEEGFIHTTTEQVVHSTKLVVTAEEFTDKTDVQGQKQTTELPTGELETPESPMTPEVLTTMAATRGMCSMYRF